MKQRTTREVIEDHLRRRLDGDLDGDLEHNYAPDVVAVSLETRGPGLEAVRGMADDLERVMPGAQFSIKELIVEGDAALEVWAGRSADGGVVTEGTDTFVVAGGRISVHTVHYHVREGGDGRG